MNFTQKIKKIATAGNEGVLILGFPPILLIAVVIVLFAMMISVCFRFTKGSLSTSSFLKRLQSLQLKFTLGKEIYPETEREEMERQQNQLKTTANATAISGNAEMRSMLSSICKSIQDVLRQPGLENRTSWIKLNALMGDFNLQYFGKTK